MSSWATLSVGNTRVAGLGNYDSNEAAHAITASADEHASNAALEAARGSAFAQSPLDRLLAEPGALDRYKGGEA